MSTITGVLALITLFTSCKEEDPGTSNFDPTYVNLEVSDSFPPLIIRPDNQPMKERIELGRMLYYDKGLATGDLTGKSCASCHQQASSFSSKLSTAVLAHVNLGWASYFLWNGAEEGTLEDVMTFEARDFFKMDLDLIRNDPTYKALFEKAFEDGAVTYDHAGKAIAQFTRSMISDNSKFDKYLRGELQLDSSEMRGYLIFNSERGDCFHCHALPFFTDSDFHNIGLMTKFKDHEGRYNVTGRTADVGAFKTPTLRNIELTAPYMHDDRFETLEEVIEHYNSGVLNSPVLDPIMTKPGKETGLHLTDGQKSDVVAFLKTLTDDSFIADPDFSDPF